MLNEATTVITLTHADINPFLIKTTGFIIRQDNAIIEFFKSGNDWMRLDHTKDTLREIDIDQVFRALSQAIEFDFIICVEGWPERNDPTELEVTKIVTISNGLRETTYTIYNTDLVKVFGDLYSQPYFISLEAYQKTLSDHRRMGHTVVRTEHIF